MRISCDHHIKFSPNLTSEASASYVVQYVKKHFDYS